MDNNNILQKLEGLESRYEEVSTLITDPDVIADQSRYVKLTKEWKDLGDIMDARKRYINCLNSIKEAKDILSNESDPEMKEMAREELNENEALQPKLEEEIKIALVPKDPEDAKNVQMEIRGGAGGDEAALFAGDLFSMYKKYCESKGWTVSVTSVSEGAVGGYKEIDFAVSGTDVYGTLKYESGVHRVQRVPATETQGRMHTSAATVAVLPEADKFEVNINEGDIKWDTFRSSVAGGLGAGAELVAQLRQHGAVGRLKGGVVQQAQKAREVVVQGIGQGVLVHGSHAHGGKIHSRAGGGAAIGGGHGDGACGVDGVGGAVLSHGAVVGVVAPDAVVIVVLCPGHIGGDEAGSAGGVVWV